jgi:hypothetical protein
MRCTVEIESRVEPVSGKLPESDQEDAHRRRGATRAELLDKAIQSIEEKLGSSDVKATFADFIRLLQLQKELQTDQPREIKVTWIDPSDKESASEE